MSATVVSPDSVIVVVDPAPVREVVVTPSQVVTVANLGIKGDTGPLTDTQLRATPVSVEVSNFPTGGGDAKDETLREIADILSHLGSIISYPSTVDRSLNRQRVTAAIESGTVTTVSTVTNVTNLNNLGGFSTVMVAQDLNFNAWSNSVGARF